MRQKGETAINASELVSGDFKVVAAFKLNKFDASGLDSAFVDLVESVEFVADHESCVWCPLGLELIVRPCPALVNPLSQNFFELKKPPEGGQVIKG